MGSLLLRLNPCHLSPKHRELALDFSVGNASLGPRLIQLFLVGSVKMGGKFLASSKYLVAHLEIVQTDVQFSQFEALGKRTSSPVAQFIFGHASAAIM